MSMKKWRDAYIRYTDGESFTAPNRVDYLKLSGWNMLLNRLAEIMANINGYVFNQMHWKSERYNKFCNDVANRALETLKREFEIKERMKK